MRCKEFLNRAHDLLDRRRRPEQDGLLLQHADECGECRDWLEGQQTLLLGLSLDDGGAGHSPRSTRDIASLVRESSRQSNWRRDAWSSGLLSSALLIAVLALSLGYWFWRQAGSGAPTGGGTVASSGDGAAEDKLQSDEHNFAPPGNQPALASASDSSADEPQPETGALPIAGSPYFEPSFEFPFGRSYPMSASIRWNYRVPTPLRPLTDPVADAFNAVRRSIPARQNDETTDAPQANGMLPMASGVV